MKQYLQLHTLSRLPLSLNTCKKSGIDIITAQCLVMRMCASGSEGVKRAADNFVEWASGILEEQQGCDAREKKEENVNLAGRRRARC